MHSVVPKIEKFDFKLYIFINTYILRIAVFQNISFNGSQTTEGSLKSGMLTSIQEIFSTQFETFFRSVVPKMVVEFHFKPKILICDASSNTLNLNLDVLNTNARIQQPQYSTQWFPLCEILNFSKQLSSQQRTESDQRLRIPINASIFTR